MSTQPGQAPHEGSLLAPQVEGYYSLTATVQAAGERVPVNELIAVEAAS